jgi:hypothetical protein
MAATPALFINEQTHGHVHKPFDSPKRSSTAAVREEKTCAALVNEGLMELSTAFPQAVNG